MLKRLQPILLKVVVQTEADIKGFINTMISSGNYHTARQKLGYLERLNQVKNRLELSDNLNMDANDLVLIQLRNAMLLTAKYLYPEEIPDDQGFLYGHFPFYSNVADTLAKVVKAVEQGDLKTLSIVLGFFKRSLLFPN
jgi:hypothetical protein